MFRNVCGSITISDDRLNLKDINNNVKNITYHPNRFPGCFLRLTNPQCTAIIFATAKVLITGAKTEEAAIAAVKRVCRLLQKVLDDNTRIRYQRSNFKITNVCASVSVGFPINLQKLYTENSKFATYEPHSNPALKYSVGDPKVTMMIYASGKVVFQGAKAVNAVNSAMEKMHYVLMKYSQDIQSLTEEN
eukprot:TRINITY_DN2549_c0_g1_i2.p1 TRINITY_DN2549_c0_g1~~TRINITY_DN2549_c0_g1_i2.p1  ORF type:complete len:190 (+),score=36.95 TRINITY_DN2549_c0_g1_i2:94-663(+)